MLRFSILILTLFLTQNFCLGKVNIAPGLQKLEQTIAKKIKTDLEELTGINKIFIKVDLDVNLNALETAFKPVVQNIEQEKIQKPSFNLPGLALGQSFEEEVWQPKAKKTREIAVNTPSSDQIYPFVSKVKINVSHLSQTKIELGEVLKLILMDHFPRVKTNNISIKINTINPVAIIPTVDENPNEKKKEVEVVPTPVEEKAKLAEVEKDYFIFSELGKIKELGILAGFFVFIFLLLVYPLFSVAIAIQKGFKQTSKVLEKTVSAETAPPPLPTQVTKQKDNEKLKGDDKQNSMRQKEISFLVEELQVFKRDHTQLLKDIIHHRLDIENFSSLAIILDSIDMSIEELTDIDINKRQKFKKYLSNNIQLLFNDSQSTVDLLRKTYVDLKSARLYPESLYRSIASEFIEGLEPAQIVRLLPKMNDVHKAVFFKILQAPSLAFLIDQKMIPFADYKQYFNKKEVSLSNLKEFSHFIQTCKKPTQNEEHTQLDIALSCIGDQLTEKNLFSFENLDKKNIKIILDFTKALGITDIASFLATFKEEQREFLLSQLPEILRERVKRHKFKVSVRGFDIKQQLLKILLFESQSNLEGDIELGVKEVGEKNAA